MRPAPGSLSQSSISTSTSTQHARACHGRPDHHASTPLPPLSSAALVLVPVLPPLPKIDATMGFPVGYSEMLLPRALLQVLLLLGHLHRFLLWAFHAVGLGDLVDLGCNYYPPPPPSAAAQEHPHPHPHQGRDAAAAPLQHRRAEFRPVPAVLIDEALPVVRFDELVAAGTTACGDGGDCAVCLSGIGGGDEVRRLSNCRHAFHRACLDRWMAHDQRTCPLCRAPLIPGAAADPWGTAAPWPDAADYDASYPSSLPSTPLLSTLPTPTLLRPHDLLLTGLGGFQ